MMHKLLTAAFLAATAGCCLYDDTVEPAATAVSPNGRNVLRLYLDPLSYEVVRDGATVVDRTPIGLKINGRCLCETAYRPTVSSRALTGLQPTPVYKKAAVNLAGNETLASFSDWSLRLVARDDGVAYRFETARAGKIRIDGEKADVTIPDAAAKALVYRTGCYGGEESVAEPMAAGEIGPDEKGRKLVYLPLVYTTGGTTVAVTDSDVRDYPIWYLTRDEKAEGVRLASSFSRWPTETRNNSRALKSKGAKRERNWHVVSQADYLVETEGTRTFPWRTFLLVDAPSKLCEADAVYALAAPKASGDFSWVRPGKVAWDWWNAFDNQGNSGCNTRTYKRFIDFAAKTGVEYVIMDEGWSEKLNIWKFHPDVDVPEIIRYANGKNVGIILWMAWAQVEGDEEHVAEHFAKLGAKGFKVDFMDRGDAEVMRFLERFARACAKNRMLIDYHGATRPTGLRRMYPNILNWEGVHGLEQMKFYHGQDMMRNDVQCYFGRLTAGPMDYTPGAMDNYPLGRYPGQTKGYDPSSKISINPGSLGTRCHQMAMMTLYEAPLQMLSDSPTKYEKNTECFSFMASTPVVWDETVGLGGSFDSFAAVARRAGGMWYASGMTNADPRDFSFDTSFLGAGEWKLEIFRDADDSDVAAQHYVHEFKTVRAGDTVSVHMAPGGGFAMRFVK